MTVTSQNISERRDFERMKINTAVTLNYGVPSKEKIEGICLNLSKSGIGIEADIMIPLGTECDITMHDGHRNKSKFQARIEIKRVQPLDDGRFILGAVILQTF